MYHRYTVVYIEGQIKEKEIKVIVRSDGYRQPCQFRRGCLCIMKSGNREKISYCAEDRMPDPQSGSDRR